MHSISSRLQPCSRFHPPRLASGSHVHAHHLSCAPSLRLHSLQPRTWLWKRWLSSTAFRRAPCTFTLRITPSPSAFAAISSSTGAGFKSSTRLACYRSSLVAASRVMAADESLRALMEAAAAGSTPAPSCCSWMCSMAEKAARHDEMARSGCSLDLPPRPPAMPFSVFSVMVLLR